jgi:ABC-type amino acid transport system permease subunit
MQAASDRIKEATGSYLTMFIIAGVVYFLGLAAIHLLAPKLQKAEV